MYETAPKKQNPARSAGSLVAPRGFELVLIINVKDRAEIVSAAGRIVKLNFLNSFLGLAATAQFAKGEDSAGFGHADAGNLHQVPDRFFSEVGKAAFYGGQYISGHLKTAASSIAGTDEKTK